MTKLIPLFHRLLKVSHILSQIILNCQLKIVKLMKKHSRMVIYHRTF